jgi:hypothetical protein
MATGITTTLRNDPVRSSQILERIQQAAGASRTMSLVRFGKQSWNDHQRGAA